ncbi:MAG: 4Fe-4S binding protein [Caldisericota bacterium]|nr:4Fe-4S binding protein [Caldisericota bacterium]
MEGFLNVFLSSTGHRAVLASFFSDFPPEFDPFAESRIAPDCEGCNACLNNCPTGAISGERFRLKTELCLAY